MTTTQSIELLQSAITVGLLWLFWIFCWKHHCIDKLRQDLFAVRGEHFLLAAKNRNSAVGFDSASYLAFRKQLNSTIRFAHNINMTRVVVYCFLRPFMAPGISINRTVLRRQTAMLSVNDHALQAQIRDMISRSNRAVFWYLVKSSPAFSIFLVGALLYAMSFAFLKVFVHRPFTRIVRSVVLHKIRGVFSAIWDEANSAQADVEIAAGLGMLARRA